MNKAFHKTITLLFIIFQILRPESTFSQIHNILQLKFITQMLKECKQWHTNNAFTRFVDLLLTQHRYNTGFKNSLCLRPTALSKLTVFWNFSYLVLIFQTRHSPIAHNWRMNYCIFGPPWKEAGQFFWEDFSSFGPLCTTFFSTFSLQILLGLKVTAQPSLSKIIRFVLKLELIVPQTRGLGGGEVSLKD